MKMPKQAYASGFNEPAIKWIEEGWSIGLAGLALVELHGGKFQEKDGIVCQKDVCGRR